MLAFLRVLQRSEGHCHDFSAILNGLGRLSLMATAAQQKTLGAFYTAETVATFLVNWAVRAADDSVLDPSCGDGVFLSAAVERLRRLGKARP